MQLDGIHHITCITADAPGNVDFYARLLGLRLVKKTVNFDSPDVYHLYFGDEHGTPGSILTFFEFPGAARGRAGAGMIHRLRWRVVSVSALDFWAQRLADGGVQVARDLERRSLHFRDPEGLELELAVVPSEDPPLRAKLGGIPVEHALAGFDGVRAYSSAPQPEERVMTEGLGFTITGRGEYLLRGGRRQASYSHDAAPQAPGLQGAGTVHHIAWCDRDADHPAWRAHLAQIGMRPTPIIDRQYFLSIYFREPHGVLFEIATPSPGFAVDEEPEHLGEALRLPPQYERRRDQLERSLTPLANPRGASPDP